MGVLPWWRMLARLAILPDGDREVGEMGGLGMVVVAVVRGWVRVGEGFWVVLRFCLWWLTASDGMAVREGFDGECFSPGDSRVGLTTG